MSLISNLVPLNLLEEKAKFLADPTYNPQFIYQSEFEPEVLHKYGLPTQQLLDNATEIVTQTYHHKTEADLFAEEGRELNQIECTDKIARFLRMHGLEDRYEIIWSASFVSRASVTNTSIKLRLPVDFHLQGLLGMIYHEIGTHALRRVNYEQQPWFKKKNKYGFGEYLITEEGLASLHSLLPHTNKSAHNLALRYLAVQAAQQGSFAEVWKFLSQYIDNPERRWIVTFRQKRGLTDTSQPGGFTKDLVYFQGVVSVWKWLAEHQFNPIPLYYGKLAYEDVDKAVAMNPGFDPLLPSFYTTNPDQYKQDMITIGQSNEWR